MIYLAIAIAVYIVGGVGIMIALHSYTDYYGEEAIFAAALWPIAVWFLAREFRDGYKDKKLQKIAVAREAENQKVLDRIIITPENPERLRFEEVFSNSPVQHDWKKCYICRRDTYDRYRVPTPLVDTVSTARVHKECLLKYIEEMK